MATEVVPRVFVAYNKRIGVAKEIAFVMQLKDPAARFRGHDIRASPALEDGKLLLV